MEQTIQTKHTELMLLFIKLDRIAAWVLFFVMILYAITGFGMTLGIMDVKLATALHLSWLGGIGLIAFVIHTTYAIRLALMRWKIWNLVSKIVMISIYGILVGTLLYWGLFYRVNQNQTKNINASPAAADQTSANVKIKNVFNAETLKKYNGQNGQPAYVAVDGNVYDLSSVFRNGYHAGYEAGQDLSVAFHSQHPSQILKAFPIVGTFQK